MFINYKFPKLTTKDILKTKEDWNLSPSLIKKEYQWKWSNINVRRYYWENAIIGAGSVKQEIFQL